MDIVNPVIHIPFDDFRGGGVYYVYMRISLTSGIYGSVIAVTLLFVSLTAAQSADISDEPKPTGQVATVAIVEEDERVPQDGTENQVQAGTPVTNIGIRASYDSGTKGDNITNNTRPSIEYTKASNGSITARYRKAGGQWAAITQIGRINNTAGSVRTPTLTGGDGDYEVEITQSIPGSTAKATYTFTLDTTAPTAYINNGQFTLNDTPIKIGENGDVSVTLQIGNNFGVSSALSADGTLLAVGASGDLLNKGSVYLFEKSDSSWSQT